MNSEGCCRSQMASISQVLAAKAKAGDREAYDQLFALHKDRALVFVRARLGPKLRQQVESMDVLQDAYQAAHKDFAKFEATDEGAFTRWLCRIIENRIRDLSDYHGAAKRQAVPLHRSAATGPLTALNRAEHRERLLQPLDQLAEDRRQVLLLRYFEGLSAEEAGAILGRTAAAIRTLTTRALADLGELMPKP